MVRWGIVLLAVRRYIGATVVPTLALERVGGQHQFFEFPSQVVICLLRPNPLYNRSTSHEGFKGSPGASMVQKEHVFKILIDPTLGLFDSLLCAGILMAVTQVTGQSVLWASSWLVCVFSWVLPGPWPGA